MQANNHYAMWNNNMICSYLIEFLDENEPITFNVVGGCGIDKSLGKESCMDSFGVWFKFCPFCGKKIVRKYENGKWDWWEEVNST